MPNEAKVSRKLFISCLLILTIIFIGIIVVQRNYYENKINEINTNDEIVNNPFTIIDNNGQNIYAQ